MIDGVADSWGLMTADELLTLDLPGKSTELVRGGLIVREPPSTYHGRVQSTLNILVGSYVRAHALGAVFGQDTGLKIASDPDTVRASHDGAAGVFAGGELDGENLIPGFSCPLNELFE